MRYLKLTSLFAFWAAIIALSLYFFMDNVVAYLYGYRSENFGNTFFNNQFWVVAHLVGGTAALLFGPLQFFKGIRTRYVSAHRTMGKVYILGAFITGLSALRLSLVSHCFPCRISLFILAVLVLLTTFAAWQSIKNRNIKAHRQFMVRSYVVILSFVAVRIDGLLPLDFLFGSTQEYLFRRLMNKYFFSFVPLLCKEIIMTWLPSIRWKSSKA